ncbi:RidA family protein [Brevibacillus nitrificans]|uniref:RidA family protein n=1 Tax=Brevibacillus nitrificans TaxID=651560 RepID=A0A3M8D560_9BACL|nr:Rid family detoxifying hydrolase [Brevibacillus nitrificans]RNB83182.1 RidA family protein [Brevibacillus nitrificans]
MKRIATTEAPKAVGPYVQAVAARGTFLYISGQLPIDPKTNEMVSQDIYEQTEQSLKNVGAILKEAELSFENLVKTTIYVTDMDCFDGINKIYASFFPEGAIPARAVVEVSKLPKGAKVEIEAVANWT